MRALLISPMQAIVPTWIFVFFPSFGEIGSFVLCLLAALIQVSYCYITLFRDSAGDRNLNLTA